LEVLPFDNPLPLCDFLSNLFDVERTDKMKRIRELTAYWKRVENAGHFGEDHKHKWWVVVLFWAVVAAAALALLTLT
jgi:hypothetical protein